MEQYPSFRQLVTDVFHRHNPLESDCLSVYDSVVNDLFQLWSYAATTDELENYIQVILTDHSKKDIKPDRQLVLEVYETRNKIL